MPPALRRASAPAAPLISAALEAYHPRLRSQLLVCEHSNPHGLEANGRSLLSNGRPLLSNGRSLEANGRSLLSNGRSLEANGRSLLSNGRSLEPNGRPLEADRWRMAV
jgi:hypothetical protein